MLSLSATPIPRTLQMSLAGLRDISVIETPPEGRRPVRTYVGPYDEELVGRAIEREVERGGQAFFLHNRIETRCTRRPSACARCCPDVRFAEAHGQMDELELEATMLAFVRGEHDCLVTTTIIESGIDIPHGEHADRRARRPARPGAGVPDPRPGRPQPRARLRLHALPLARDAHRRRRRPARDPLRQHRARLGLPGRDARPRDPRRRQPARRRAVRATSPRSASSSTARCSRTRPRRSARASEEGEGPARSASRSGSSSTSTPTCPATTSRSRRRRSTSTAASPPPASAASCAPCARSSRTASARVPEPGREPARAAARPDRAGRRRGPHVEFRAGRLRASPLELDSEQAAALGERVPDADLPVARAHGRDPGARRARRAPRRPARARRRPRPAEGALAPA